MELKERLVTLADKYENPSFLEKDPSKFMHRYLPKNGGSVEDAQVVAFIAANLAFGRREQILSHIELILQMMKADGKMPVQWILDGKFNEHFALTKNSFYRMYTYQDMNVFFKTLQSILKEDKNLGSYFEKKWKNACADSDKILLHQVIAQEFSENCSLISRSKDGAAKKLNMFLRWMVRTSSPVDLGLWTWYDRAKLLLPLDTHVMQEAVKFGFLEKTSSGKVPSANLKTALALTEVMDRYFTGDPVRADFALFGLGVDENRSTE